MAFSYSLTSPSPNSTLSYSSTHQFLNPSSSFPVSLSVSSPKNTRHLRLLITSALNPQTGQPTKKASTGSDKSSTNKKRKKKGKIAKPVEDWELRDSEDAFEEDDDADYSSSSSSLATFNSPPTIPKPPAGFVINETGRVLMASKKRITTVIDPTNNSPLDCVIRRVFTSSKGEDCMLLCPVDTPVQILKSTNIDGWSAVSDEEVESLLPAAAYALAKIHMHLVHSGFCYTARGGFCAITLVACVLAVAAILPCQAQDPLAVKWTAKQGLLKYCIESTKEFSTAGQNIWNAYNNCHTNLLRSYNNRHQTLLLSGYLAGMIECGRATALWEVGSIVGDVMMCVALALV